MTVCLDGKIWIFMCMHRVFLQQRFLQTSKKMVVLYRSIFGQILSLHLECNSGWVLPLYLKCIIYTIHLLSHKHVKYGCIDIFLTCLKQQKVGLKIEAAFAWIETFVRT